MIPNKRKNPNKKNKKKEKQNKTKQKNEACHATMKTRNRAVLCTETVIKWRTEISFKNGKYTSNRKIHNITAHKFIFVR